MFFELTNAKGNNAVFWKFAKSVKKNFNLVFLNLEYDTGIILELK